MSMKITENGKRVIWNILRQHHKNFTGLHNPESAIVHLWSEEAVRECPADGVPTIVISRLFSTSGNKEVYKLDRDCYTGDK